MAHQFSGSAVIEGGKVTSWRVNMQITFEVEDASKHRVQPDPYHAGQNLVEERAQATRLATASVEQSSGIGQIGTPVIRSNT